MNACPFCGQLPEGYVLLKGSVCGYPVLTVNIKCSVCDFVISGEVPYISDKGRNGQTPPEYIEMAFDKLKDKWNRRI